MSSLPHHGHIPMGCTRQLSGFVFVYERGRQLFRSLAGLYAFAFRQCLSAPSVLSLPLGIVVRVVGLRVSCASSACRQATEGFTRRLQILRCTGYRMLMYKMAQPRHLFKVGCQATRAFFAVGKEGDSPVR